MLSKKKSSVYQNKSSSQHCALRGSDANFELIDNNLAADQKFARTGQRVFGFGKLAAVARDTVISEILRNVATRLASYKDPEGLRVVCTENLNPDVVMMKSAQDWVTKNVSGAIDGARDRCIFLQG
jgi:hypothetical protein